MTDPFDVTKATPEECKVWIDTEITKALTELLSDPAPAPYNPLTGIFGEPRGYLETIVFNEDLSK